ncbi:DUF4435 domain-containing protein [Methylophilus sp. 14]|uniref:DUF4435 domain-containing protein n=1 Tax=Methylophilus sp. 14 TaxID=2781019 RepID=UPI00188EDE01|nr:DUF4435 domain-containing protein [Methylophilus sp. 14]MBF4987173.1 DUF4435 domain-containing protein [Methylophilus sp. 14]
MTFMRSNAGISNYSMFYNTEIVIFTEGKTLDSKNELEVVPDCTFFHAIFSKLIPNHKIKIKAIGNKRVAYEYALALREAGTKNSFVIVDRDYDEILSGLEITDKVICTSGYSWENDLWNEQLILNIVDAVTFGNSTILDTFKLQLKRLVRRIRYLSILDALCQTISKAILDKSKALRGISLQYSSKCPITRNDIKRLSKPFKILFPDISTVKPLLQRLINTEPEKIVQGHFWQNIVTKLLGHIFMTFRRDSRPSDKTLLFLAIQEIKNNTSNYQTLLNYYGEQLKRVSVDLN